MAREDVTSREYKLMLLPEKFAGDEATARRAIDAFWQDLAELLKPADIPTAGSFDDLKAHRLVRFFDTTDHQFNENRYIFRERVDVDTQERQVTLKYRHPDRYVTADRTMASAEDDVEIKTKFEQDVKPPFSSVYSYSTTVGIDADRSFERVADVAAVFPGLTEELKDLDEEARLTLVRDFTARETVLAGANLLLGKRDSDAECAFVIWHDDDDETTPPVAVEFSFKYGDDLEQYRGSVARDAHDILQLLHEQMPEWVHPQPRTKTAFVYG